LISGLCLKLKTALNLQSTKNDHRFAPENGEKCIKYEHRRKIFMSLILCPDCGHEVSTSAVACQNCGRPIADPLLERNVVVTEVPPPVVRDEFPKWAIIPLAALGLILLFTLFYFMSREDETANTNVNVSTTNRRPVETRDTTSSVRTEPNQINVPSSDSPSSISVPQTQPQTQIPSTVTNVPSETTTVKTDKGMVRFQAKIMTKTGGTQAVKNERFYLLKKDLEEVLQDADIEDETGQGLRNAFGLSILYPERYREINQKALAEIKKNTVYATSTGATGEGMIKDIKPDNYYLFAITKTRNGFAIWSAPVNIIAGENVLNLSPAQMTEIEQQN
jgi:ribosomal protein S27E